MSPTKVLILLTTGVEEIEFVTMYDLLVRAGAEVTSASVQVEGGSVKCSRGVVIQPDTTLESLDLSNLTSTYTSILIPGGMPNALALSSNPIVLGVVREFWDAGKVVGMICAGVLVALKAELAGESGKLGITSHPSVKDQLVEAFEYKDESVVVSATGKKTLITSRGPGSSIAFTLKLIETIFGPEKRKEIEGPLMCC